MNTGNKEEITTISSLLYLYEAVKKSWKMCDLSLQISKIKFFLWSGERRWMKYNNCAQIDGVFHY